MTDLVTVQPLERAATIPNLIREFCDTQLVGCGPRRIREVENMLNRWCAFLANRKLEPMTFARYPAYLQEKNTHPNTINAQVRIVRKFLKWCFLCGFTKERWYEFIPTVRGVAPGEPIIVTQSEYEKLIEICTDRDLKWGIVCGYHTGIRLGDVCNLRWSAIDMDRQLVATVQGKTGRATGKMVQMPFTTQSDIHVWLLELREESECRPDDYVSYSLHVRYAIDPTCISRYYIRLFNKAGLPDKSFKHFRSTFESRLANSGMNLAMAAAITGRSDPKALMRYIKVDIEAAREGVAKAMEIHQKYPDTFA
jgi:integrase